MINLGDRSVGGCKESEVGIVSTVQLKGLEEELKGQECLATVKTIMLHSCSLRYPFWFSEMNLETDLLVDVVSVRRKFGMEILLGCVGSGTEEVVGAVGSEEQCS